MFAASRIWHDTAAVCGWGGFLILTSVAVGSLYETKERQLFDLKNAYMGVLEVLSKYLESTDPYTSGHSVRVSELATAIATDMQLSAEETDNIRVAGLLHDIGKIEISGEVLRKAANLTSDEQVYMESHAQKGARLLSSIGGSSEGSGPDRPFAPSLFREQAGVRERCRPGIDSPGRAHNRGR
ncbi:MAG: HD domain-containing protein [Acidobacteria bacterium]|nr:MAG: HD domain-containing protein [Acidobacteriota bacterium]